MREVCGPLKQNATGNRYFCVSSLLSSRSFRDQPAVYRPIYKRMFNSIFLLNFLGPEMIVVFLAILLLFGGKKIPELMRGIGKGIREFNTAKGTLEKELQDGMREEEQREKDARELKELREREARRQREEQFITRDEKSA